jgi:hypothetical protein
MSIVVKWWDESLRYRHGGERLAGLDVFYDFVWPRVFGHGRTTFPYGQSLARLVKRESPKGLKPTLLLTNRDDVDDDPIETGDSRFVVVVRIQDYLAQATPDPAQSYFGAGIGPRLAAAKELRELATRADVVKAVVKFGLTIEDIQSWASLGKGRHELLKAVAGSDEGEQPKASLEQIVEVLRGIQGLDAEITDGLAALLSQEGDNLEARLQLLHALTKDAFDNDEARTVFLRSNRDLLAAILRSDVEAPDIVALAHRRKVLTLFERLLDDDAFFDAEKKSCGGSAEKVWQRFIEVHPWVLGSALAPQFLHSWSKERLEQTVKGFSIAGPGKRADAVLRTAGALSAVVLAEIKHHRTHLLKNEYRPGCWSVSGEVAGGIAQCQGTADEAEAALGKTVDLKSEDGYVIDRAFVCRPRTVLVVGSLTEFVDDRGHAHHEKFESFERFRRGLRDPEILTFDELFERARLALALEDVASASVEVGLQPG